MSILDKIKKLFSLTPKNEHISFNIKCGKCQEIITVHVSPTNDLMNQYTDLKDSGPAYILKKEVLGNNCNNLMKLTVEFDKNYNVISKSAEGGEVIL